MKAEHLDEQPSITNTDDKVLSKLSQHWLKIIEGIADTKGGQEALDQYFTNKIKEAELKGRIDEHKVILKSYADWYNNLSKEHGVKQDVPHTAFHAISERRTKELNQLTNQYKGEQDDE